MDSNMVTNAQTETKDDVLECQKAQEVIGLLLNKADEANETNLQAADFSVNKALQDLSSSAVTVTIPGSSPMNICHVSLTESGMILESSEIVQSSLSGSPFVKLEDGTTAFVQSFEAVEEADGGDATPKFIDGQAVRLEDGTTAFIHAAPREGLQPVQLEDGTMAYLSQTATDLFTAETSTLDLEQLANSSQVIDVTMKEISENNMVEKTSRSNSSKNGGKNFQCDFPNCQRLYTTLHHLKVHARSHTGDKPYKCTMKSCKKAFSTGYGLKSHIRVHTGETPYKCPEEFCKKAFKASGDLQKHVRTHTGERPFKCPYEGCNRAFTTSNIRKVHFRTHTGERPYICEFEGCGKAFASATNYKNHIRIHTGEKPYVCLVPGCNRKFTEYSSLYKHNIIHTHAKPYVCGMCGKDYRQISTLTMHKRTVHGVIDSNGNEVSVSEDSEPKSNTNNSELPETAVQSVNNKTKQKMNIKSQKKLPDSGATTKPSKSFPTIVTLQGNSSTLIQEQPVFTVQLQEDGTLSNTMLVADSAQLAAFQHLAQQGPIEAVLVEANMNSMQETPAEEILSSKTNVQN